MDSQVEEIKKKLDIVEIINRYLPLKKRGRHHIACCPFHGEKTPSFTVSPELQIFKCFGCGKSGDVFTFVQEFNKIDFREALEDLAKIAGVTLVKSAHLTQEESHRSRLFLVNQEVAKFYHYILTSHPLGKPALDYVLKRGITLDTIKLFKIGYAPTNTSLISQYLLKKNFTIPELIDTGTFGNSHYGRGQLYDRFQDRLVFPLVDFRDRILGFSGRILPFSKNPNSAKYINSPETSIYHKSQTLFGINLVKEAIKSAKSVVVTEGEFDMISPFQSGIQNIVAIKGTAFTPDQLQLLHRYTDTLILALDSDFAGNNAARKSIALADSMDFDIKVVSLGDRFKDPDEAVKADPEFFKTQVGSPIPVWDFIIASAVKSVDINSVSGKKTVLSQVLPFITQIKNSVIRSDYLNKLALEIGSSPESVLEESKKINSSPVTTKNLPGRSPTLVGLNDPAVQHSKTEKLEEYLLSLIFGSRQPALVSRKIKKNYTFTTPRFKLIFDKLLRLKKFSPKLFITKLPPELQPTFQDVFLLATNTTIESTHRRLEISKIINQLLSLLYRDQLKTLGDQIARAETVGDEALLSTLEKDYNSVLLHLSGLSSTKS
ncbi:DNA primase [Candidatus Shapirobacteria bacterium]|nr:DNA primase [Candidatus Shapirobacteria bacterium]